jgi:hypothetical protein
MNKYGPTKADLRFRLCVALLGLVLVAAALAYRGLPTGPGGREAIGIAAIFFGGTLVWTLRKLVRKEYSDGL